MSEPEPNASPVPSHEARLFTLFNEIGIINQLSSTAFERVLPHGLTQAQFTVLNHCIRLGDNKTPAQLASAFQVTRGTLTSTLQRLEAKGFIALVPDAKDGRSKRVLLTAAGRNAAKESIVAAAPILTRAQAALSREEVEDLMPILIKLRIWLDTHRSL
ncbi:MAG: MarR family transcriptional regulator [Phenylobacterium sp.]|uniref:MarR family winged helix-turn-helix transcriptional regulator n=1 Tax=Phenylobacterium sp. TaxID=1871053 RepID=UPI0025D76747|nr:MarR family transcriptional regulator [Phenylobacterium sp.]MCG9914961.1 MarR family transcriptional regulator [Phenylobacterium sp.]